MGTPRSVADSVSQSGWIASRYTYSSFLPALPNSVAVDLRAVVFVVEGTTKGTIRSLLKPAKARTHLQFQRAALLGQQFAGVSSDRSGGVIPIQAINLISAK